jgi:DMSO/TMAO reductase YedYZ molybdopterin-dependent catalytic subunit
VQRDESDNRVHRGDLLGRRRVVKALAAGSVIAALGGLYRVAGDAEARAARAETRPDGRPRLPPGQKIIQELRPMGGRPGDARPSEFSLRVHGEVAKPFILDFARLLALPQTEQVADVHCVTGWSVLGHRWQGVRVALLAQMAGLLPSARYAIFEAAHGYTANVPLREAIRPEVLVAHRMQDRPLSRVHGAPVRSLVPDLYFWKSAKWLTGIRFVARDDPGYWERRGYHNHGDPWREQRFG